MSKCPVGFRRHKQKCVRVRTSVGPSMGMVSSSGFGANVKPIEVHRLFVVARASRTSAIAAGRTSDGLIVLPNGRVGEGEPMLAAARRLLAVDGWALNEGANDAEFITKHTVDFPVRGKNYRWILVPGGTRWVGAGEPVTSTPAALLYTGRGNSDGRVMRLMDIALGHHEPEVATQYDNAEARAAREIYELESKVREFHPSDPDADTIDANADRDDWYDEQAAEEQGFERERVKPMPTAEEYFAKREEARRKADEFEAAEQAAKAEKREKNLRRLAAKGTPGAGPKAVPTLVDFKALRRRVAYQTPTEIAIWVGKKNADPLPVMVHKGRDTFIRGREVFDKAGNLAYVWYVLEGTEPNISLRGLGSLGAESEDDDVAVSAPIKKKAPAAEVPPKWPSPALRIPVEELPFTPTEDLPFERTPSGQPKRLSPSEQEKYFAFEEQSPEEVRRYYRFTSSWEYTGFLDSKRNLIFRKGGFETRFGQDFLVFIAKREAVAPVDPLRATPRSKLGPTARAMTASTRPEAPDPVVRATNAQRVASTLTEGHMAPPHGEYGPRSPWATFSPPLVTPWPQSLTASVMTPRTKNAVTLVAGSSADATRLLTAQAEARAEAQARVKKGLPPEENLLALGIRFGTATNIHFRHFKYGKVIRFEGHFEGHFNSTLVGALSVADVRAAEAHVTGRGDVQLPVQWQKSGRSSSPEQGTLIVSPAMAEVLLTWTAKLANEQLGRLSGAGSWGPHARPVRG